MRNLWIGLAIVCLTLCLYVVAQAKDPSLVLYFTFEEGRAEKVLDQSGNGHSGKIQGGAKWTKEGKYGSALSFDGVDDVVVVSYEKSLDLTGNFTVEAWFYPTIVDGQWRWAINKSSSNADLNYLLGIGTDNKFQFITRKDLKNWLHGQKAIPKQWYHVAGVVDSKNKRVILYVNAEESVSQPLVGEETTNDSDLVIGCRGDGFRQFYGGLIDEVAILSKALTQDEIKQHMKGNIATVRPSGKLTTTWGGIKSE